MGSQLATAGPKGDNAPAALRRDAVSAGLMELAGRKRFSGRRRRFDVSFSDRSRSRATRLFTATTFVAFLGAPGVAAIGYFGWFAADQYVAEARFVLQANKATLSGDLGDLTGAPSIEMVRDTLMIVDYLQSRAAVEALDADIGLRARFEGPEFSWRDPFARLTPDPVARLEPDAAIEEMVDYWRDMVTADVRAPSGIVTLKVRAFTPDDAQLIAARALDRAEALVNDMNTAVWRDAVEKGETLFAAAAARLGEAERSLSLARSEEGVIDVDVAATLLGSVAAKARGTVLALEQDYAANARHLSADAPQMQALARRIESARAQIADVDAMIVAPEAKGDARSLADAKERFAELDTERVFAERQFLAAATKLEKVREVSRSQMLYLDVFVTPGLAQEATHPRRGWLIGIVLLVGAGLWGAAVGLFSVVRHHIA